MKQGFIALILTWILGLILHFLKKYLDKVLIRQKEKYKIFLENGGTQNKMKFNIEKTKVEYLEVYNKGLGFGKWACLFLGIFALFRAIFPQYFE